MPNRRRPRVLIVEDAPDVRRLLERFIRLLDLDPLLAEDGEHGWRLLNAMDPPPALLITDSAMPNMSGRELIRLVRERLPQLPILRVTGSDGLSDPLRIPDCVTLQKPFTMDEFTAAVGGLLHRP